MTKSNTKQIEVTETETVEPKIKGVPRTVIQPTKDQIKEMEGMNTSSKIRYLSKEGYSTKENMYSGIANYLGIKTQFVRNVLNRPLKKG